MTKKLRMLTSDKKFMTHEFLDSSKLWTPSFLLSMYFQIKRLAEDYFSLWAKSSKGGRDKDGKVRRVKNS